MRRVVYSLQFSKASSLSSGYIDHVLSSCGDRAAELSVAYLKRFVLYGGNRAVGHVHTMYDSPSYICMYNTVLYNMPVRASAKAKRSVAAER